MPRGDKGKYTDKEKRQAEHIEEGYEQRGVAKDEAERRAWATVNKVHKAAKNVAAGGTASATTPPLLIASTRSLFFILAAPDTPNSEARACSWGSFMALRAPDVSGAVVVSVTTFLPSHGPGWLSRCECIHGRLRVRHRQRKIATWIAIRRGDTRQPGDAL